MYGIDDVRTEVRKITSSKPVHAAAGAGVLATQTLRELPGRLVRGIDGTVMSWPARATEYVQTARAKAAGQYDMLADRGKQALTGKDDEPAKSVLNGTASTAKASTAKASTARGQHHQGWHDQVRPRERAWAGRNDRPAPRPARPHATVDRHSARPLQTKR